MTVEEFLCAGITSDPAIEAAFGNRPVDEWFFQSGSLGVGENPAVPERPYLAWNELDDREHPEVRETSDCRTRTFQWWVYDHLGSYDRINAILRLIKLRIKAMDSFVTADGEVCMQSQWLGTSNQIPNDGYDSSTKFGSSQHAVNR